MTHVDSTPSDAGPQTGPDVDLRWRVGLAELLTELATGFIHCSPGDMDAVLTESLERLARFLGADRACVYRVGADRKQLQMAHHWRAETVPSMTAHDQTINRDDAPFLIDPLAVGECVQLPSASLPADEAAAADELMAAAGIRAVILLPLRVDDRLIGVVRIDAVHQSAPWPSAAGVLLQPFGEMCTQALAAQMAIAGLEASEVRYRSVLDEVGDVIVRIGADGTLSYVNRAWYELTGNPVADTVGANPLANVHPHDRHLAAEHMAAVAAAPPGVRMKREVRFLTGDGGVRWMEVTGRAVRDADGTVVGFSGVMRDVTESKEAQARLQAARDEAERARDHAERASRAKSEFLSRMSHELRTPLNAILGFAQLLEFAALDGEDADNLRQISRAGRHLLELINDALDISRIEAGKLSMMPEPLRLAEVVTASANLIRSAAADRNVTVRLPAADDTYVVADRQRLTQVLVNVLSNAVKYNRPNGDIALGWGPLPGDVAPPEPEGSWLRIEVTDTGIGIPADRLDDVFLPFERVGAEGTDVEGTGIGLSLTQSLVSAMGGRIGVCSTVGVGSTFYLDLPMAESPATAAPPAGVETVAATRTVLYIEDNPSNLTLMRRIFAHRPQLELITATHATDGLAKIRAKRPDLILLDLHLPGFEDGEAILKTLRSEADLTLSGIPVVVVTADLSPGTEARLLQAGAQAFLAKPVDIAALLKAVDEHTAT